MPTRLIQVVAFVNVAPAATVPLPHNININDVAKKPDFVAADVAGFTIAVTATQVSVTNTNAAPMSVNVWLELKHSIPRELGGGVQVLTPQPFVASPGAAGGSPTIIVEDEGVAIPGNPFTVLNFTGAGVTAADGGGGTADVAIPGSSGPAPAVIFDDAIPANEVNIRSDRASNQSPIDNTKAGITNLGSATGAFPSTGATGNYSTIGGGDDNSAAGDWATIAGGRDNATFEFADVVSGGSENRIPQGGGANAIGGGRRHTINNVNAFADVISGGDTNTINAEYAAAIAGGGGQIIDANGDQSFIGGGGNNYINADGAFVGGGYNNQIYDSTGVIAGGEDNRIQGFTSAVLGGGSNNVDSDFSGIVAGDNNGIGISNPASSTDSFIGAGRQNRVDDDRSGIVAGTFNSINNLLTGAQNSFIGAGQGNEINNAIDSSIVGGADNTLDGSDSVIAGGRQNTIANANYAAISGGDGNQITDNGDWSAIHGGRENFVRELGGQAAGFRSEVAVGAFNSHAYGHLAKCWLDTGLTWASGDANFQPAGRWQVSWLVGRFGPANAPIGPTQSFSFGQTYQNINLPNGKAYAIRARASAVGAAGAQGAVITQEMFVTKVAGVVTVVGQGQASTPRGSATATANWTVIGRASAGDLFIDFSTGADGVTANVSVAVHVEIVEVPIF